MIELEEKIIVGILGQWASGKSTAARTLVGYLGGEDEVVFITDRELLASQAVNHILELEDSKIKLGIEDDGRQRIEGELATVWLGPEEDLKTVDLNTLLFDLHDDVYDKVAPATCSWFDRARLELGYQIRERAGDGKPIVIEAGFGTNMEPRGENPFSHTISDLFCKLEEAGVESKQVKWIIVEAGFEKRSERNQKRQDSVPTVEFDRFAAAGGGLAPDHRKRLEEQGTTIKRVPNDHDDIERFTADIIIAFEEMFRGLLPARTVDDRRELR
jgi:energy-coupling factor transporter ATP-binding protein EcfA2